MLEQLTLRNVILSLSTRMRLWNVLNCYTFFIMERSRAFKYSSTFYRKRKKVKEVLQRMRNKNQPPLTDLPHLLLLIILLKWWKQLVFYPQIFINLNLYGMWLSMIICLVKKSVARTTLNHFIVILGRYIRCRHFAKLSMSAIGFYSISKKRKKYADLLKHDKQFSRPSCSSKSF